MFLRFNYLAFCSDISLIHYDGYEITELYQVPISDLLNPLNLKTRTTKNLKYPYFNFQGKVIWGATAMILSEILEIIKNSTSE